MYLFGFKSKERYTYGGPCPVFTLRDLAIDFKKEYWKIYYKYKYSQTLLS